MTRFSELVAVLRAIKGKFLLSFNESPEVGRALRARRAGQPTLHLLRWQRFQGLQQRTKRDCGEILAANYKLNPARFR